MIITVLEIKQVLAWLPARFSFARFGQYIQKGETSSNNCKGNKHKIFDRHL